MLTNPDIFGNLEENKASEGAQTFSKTVAIVMSALVGASQDRWEQIHAVYYAIGITIFCIIFTIEKFYGGGISWIMNRLCCKKLNSEEEKDSFSSNIYHDIAGYMQYKEYKDTKLILKELNRRMNADEASEFNSLRAYYRMRLELKLSFIRLEIAKGMAISKTAA